MKYKYMLILLAFSDLIILTTGSVLSSWRFGYESRFFPMYDFNHQLSGCTNDLQCETLYMDYKDYSNYVIVSNHIRDEMYNGVYS